ncbi:MAG: ATP-dependent helicase [Acidimicrobiales bacterium]
MSEFPGPPALGRGIVVNPGAAPPPGAANWPRRVVDAEALARPSVLADELHRLWLERVPVVIELDVDAGALREPERCDRPPYELDPGHDFARERLQYLVWSNNYDGRETDAAPIWWHTRRAARLGAIESEDGDVKLPDGTAAWCDGGPRGSLPVGTDFVVLHRESIEAGSLTVDRASLVSSELAPDQLRAVAHLSGPARIIAPAGSGKTRVLTERLRHLLADRQVTASTVVAVAFNKRAADELLERTAGLPAHIRTLNALGLAIVNGSSPFGPTGAPRRSVIDERDVRHILQSLLPVRRLVNTDPWLPYLEALSMVRLGLVAPTEAEEAIPDAAGIADAFNRYRTTLADNNFVDFDEQIYLAIELLLTRPDLRSRAQSHARHLLVDEFQDLTPAHLLLLRLLSAPTHDVFGVGDDDQVIYSYAGATPEFLIGYERYFPGASLYALETNYRCPPAVVQAASRLLARNRRRVRKSISPSQDGRVVPECLRVDRRPSLQHAESALSEIRRWSTEGAAWADIAVLARVNAALLPFQVTLCENGVPCTVPLGPDILNRTGIKAALAYLRIGCDPAHILRGDVAETIRRPSRKIARNVTELLLRRPTTSVSDIRSLASALSGGDVEKLEGYADDLELLARTVAGGTTAASLSFIRRRIGLGQAMDVLDSSKRDLDRSTHLDDLAALEQVAGLHEDPESFEGWLREMLAVRAPESDAGLVTLSTVHRVKGQEWPHVLVVGASEEMFPHRLAGDIEEERRIFHVAITRCSSDVVVLADRDAPARFCDEMFREFPQVQPEPVRLPRVEAKRPKTLAPLPPGALGAEGQEAREQVSKALRDWRRSTALRDKVPAYVVLSDDHLEGIAARAPGSLSELAGCRGIGPTKLERYGDEILAVIDSVRCDA